MPCPRADDRDNPEGRITATILVADDEAFIVDLVAAVLKEDGHRIVRAYDGARALALLQAGGLDLLITDNMMPGLGGLELIARLDEHPALAVPVILMSAVMPARMPSHVAFLAKPFDIRRLTAVVAAQLAT